MTSGTRPVLLVALAALLGLFLVAHPHRTARGAATLLLLGATAYCLRSVARPT